jgi:HSP20 family protein
MTPLVKWAPFQDLDLIERRMWRTLQDIGMAPTPLPAVDFYETDKELIVELDVPGFDEKELTLEVTDHTLTIKGERAKEKEKKEKTFHVHERIEKHFERRFAFPLETNLDHVEAKFEKGVLEVHVPKLEPAKARKIDINA